jgi:catechol 1,2-dioxygenase
LEQTFEQRFTGHRRVYCYPSPMKSITVDNVTEVVVGSMSKDMTPRAREVMTALVTHLHAFAREVKLTHEDWLVGIDYMTRTGKMTDDKRNEFILVSDVLGLESLCDAISHDAKGKETESAVLGPFFREGGPHKKRGESIATRGETDGPSCLLHGRVTDVEGKPIANARINVWETGPEGLYEQQDAAQPDMNLRGVYETDANGTYEIRAVRPVPYPVPYDGPAGDILKIMGRHPYRPAHIHMIVEAPGYKKLVSQLYDKTDKYLDSDSVYAVKDSLLLDFVKTPAGSATKFEVTHDVVMKRSK